MTPSMRSTTESSNIYSGAQKETRDRLIRAAAKLFGSHGFDKTTVRDIAREADLNLSLVSYYFDGKEGIYTACLEQLLNEKIKSRRNLLEPATNATEFKVKFKMLVEEELQFRVNHPDLANMITAEIRDKNPFAKRVMDEIFWGRHIAEVQTFFKDAHLQGFTHREINPFVLFASLFGTLTLLVEGRKEIHSRAGIDMEDQAHRRSLGESLARIYLEGILPSAK